MRKLFEKWVCKNIQKNLKIYQNSIENARLVFKKYIDRTIYFEIDYLVKLIKERESENNGKRN